MKEVMREDKRKVMRKAIRGVFREDMRKVMW